MATKRKKPKRPAAKPKTTAESTEPVVAEPAIAKVPQAHGGALNAGGTPGNAGGGRPPNWLRDFCDDLLASEACKKQVEEILADKEHPAFATMWKAAGDRAKGKPAQSIDVTSNGKTLEQLVVASWDLTVTLERKQ